MLKLKVYVFFQEEIRRSRSEAKERKGQLVVEKLREQFLNQTKKYLGVPYAQRDLDPTRKSRFYQNNGIMVSFAFSSFVSENSNISL